MKGIFTISKYIYRLYSDTMKGILFIRDKHTKDEKEESPEPVRVTLASTLQKVRVARMGAGANPLAQMLNQSLPPSGSRREPGGEKGF
jgi:hypothetical protein